jgi:serine/threonine protein kinase
MLSGADPRVMSILQCLHVQRDANGFQVLYEVPPYLVEPQSLRSLLMNRKARNKDGLLHPLNHRVRLANHLATAVLYVPSGHYVHKHINPENIVVFVKKGSQHKFPDVLGHPFLLGFDKSRAERAETIGKGDIVIADCIYQHPERWGVEAEHKFSMFHDVYSLGVVLLEVGLWKSFVVWKDGTRLVSWSGLEDLISRDTLNPKTISSDVQTRFIEKAKNLLPGKMGRRYTDVVITCLSGSFQDGVEDELQAKLGLGYIKNVAARLENIQV